MNRVRGKSKGRTQTAKPKRLATMSIDRIIEEVERVREVHRDGVRATRMESANVGSRMPAASGHPTMRADREPVSSLGGCDRRETQGSGDL